MTRRYINLKQYFLSFLFDIGAINLTFLSAPASNTTKINNSEIIRVFVVTSCDNVSKMK